MFKTKEFDILNLEGVKKAFDGIDNFIVEECDIKCIRTIGSKETECFLYDSNGTRAKTKIRQFFADNLLMINKVVTTEPETKVLKKITVICSVAQIAEVCQIQIDLEERNMFDTTEAPFHQDRLTVSLLSTRYS